MSKHTAGPWRATDISTIGKTLTGCPLVVDKDGNRITVIEFSPIVKDFAELQANATLIAAAPELLNMLDLVTMELQQIHAQYLPNCPGGCPSVTYIAEALTLIKRAKGE